MATHEETSERSQYLSFMLAGTDCAVGILKVKEILQWEGLTTVPTVPASVRGVINLRGAVVPVVDLAVKFGLPETRPSKLTCILIVEVKLGDAPAVMGIMADEVREVIELDDSEVEPAPPFGNDIRVEFLLGMGKVGKDLVLLLDLDRVLSAPDEAPRVSDEVAPADGVEIAKGGAVAKAAEAPKVAEAPEVEVAKAVEVSKTAEVAKRVEVAEGCSAAAD